MSKKIKRKILGPRSKYDDTLPYTYMARVPAIEGDDELFSYYFADTICGLIEYLYENDIKQEEVTTLHELCVDKERDSTGKKVLCLRERRMAA